MPKLQLDPSKFRPRPTRKTTTQTPPDGKQTPHGQPKALPAGLRDAPSNVPGGRDHTKCGMF
ncbi:hypothetical protein SB78_05665, partial [Rickettsia asembonensis]